MKRKVKGSASTNDSIKQQCHGLESTFVVQVTHESLKESQAAATLCFSVCRWWSESCSESPEPSKGLVWLCDLSPSSYKTFCFKLALLTTLRHCRYNCWRWFLCVTGFVLTAFMCWSCRWFSVWQQSSHLVLTPPYIWDHWYSADAC